MMFRGQNKIPEDIFEDCETFYCLALSPSFAKDILIIVLLKLELLAQGILNVRSSFLYQRQ